MIDTLTCITPTLHQAQHQRCNNNKTTVDVIVLYETNAALDTVVFGPVSGKLLMGWRLANSRHMHDGKS